MEKRKTAKGFTLIELIIVLALFSIILMLVMSFIDPVSRLMKKASIKERTAAYVDNIGEYLEDSLRYARFMRVYQGGYTGIDSEGKHNKSEFSDNEKRMVESLVHDYFDGAVDDNCQPLTGKVRVLKLINTPTGECKDVGQIYETIYSFKAGDSYVKGGKRLTKYDPEITIDTSHTNIPVVNKEHLEEYAFYYKTGFYTLDSIASGAGYKDKDDDTKSFKATSKYYYSVLNNMTYDEGGVDKDVTYTHGKTFALGVVSYVNKNGENHKEFAEHNGVTVPVFKSPSHLTTVSMALLNAVEPPKIDDDKTADQIMYCRLERDDQGDLKDGKTTFVPVCRKDLLQSPYMEIAPTYGTSDGLTDNIYIIYVSPDEISDTYIMYN